MGVGINSTRKNIPSGRIHNLRTGSLQIHADHDDNAVLNEDVPEIRIRRCYDGAVFNNFLHILYNLHFG
ncbi:hypothetical protein D3C76_1627790 [compost metagenome]